MKEVIDNIYNDILELSDLDTQSQYWLGKSSTHVSSYIEVMCRLFDDNHFDDFIDKETSKLGFSNQLINELEKLREMLNNYQEKETDLEIIEDKEWQPVVNQAQKVIELWSK